MADERTKELVLVTGGSGYLGSHCILKALSDGYRVRTTVRSLSREKEVREMLTAGGATNLVDVTFVEADLSKDDGWVEAAKGCTYVLHVASPLPASLPKHEDEVVKPAREGALRVLRAARDAGVKRVVMTSSMASVAYGHPFSEYAKREFTEKDWSIPDAPSVKPYPKSKTLAERDAWEFMEREGGSMELATVNPALILGPVLGPDRAPSIELIVRLLNGSMPLAPKLSFQVVDVRDVAALHLAAMTSPKAAGERFIAIVGPVMTVREIGAVLRKRMPAQAKKVPSLDLPNPLARIMAIFDPEVKMLIGDLDMQITASSAKAESVLGWKPRSYEDVIVDTAESVIKYKLV